MSEKLQNDIEYQTLRHICGESSAEIAPVLKILEGCGITPSSYVSTQWRALFVRLVTVLKEGHEPTVPYLKSRFPELDSESLVLVVENPAIGRLEQYANLLRRKQILADYFGALRAAWEAGRNGDIEPSTLIDNARNALAAIQTPTTGMGLLSDTFHEFLDRQDQIYSGKIRSGFVRTGFKTLDDATNGFPPNICAIGANPGTGKSAFAYSLLRNIAGRGERCAYFSLEDNRDTLYMRWISFFSKIPLNSLRNDMWLKKAPRAESESYALAAEKVHDLGQHVDIFDKESVGIDSLIAECKNAIYRGARILLVDHIGEITRKGKEPDYLQVAAIARQLRDVAKQHNLPVVIFSHLKAGIGRYDIPQNGDFALTSEIGKMSRLSLGLYLDEQEKDVVMVNIAKQTNGISNTQMAFKMAWSHGMFEDDKYNHNPASHWSDR